MVKLSKLHKRYICGEKEEHVTVQGDSKTSHYAVLDVVKGLCAVFVIMLHSIPGGGDA